MMLWWLVLTFCIVPVCAVGAPPESTVAAAGVSLVIDRVRTEILRRMRRKRQADQWRSSGLQAWTPSPKLLKTSKPTQPAAAASAESVATETDPSSQAAGENHQNQPTINKQPACHAASKPTVDPAVAG
jgi:hypothetical protein